MQDNLAEEAVKTLRSELTDYLLGKQSLQSFFDWFGPESTDVHLWASEDLVETINAIRLLLAEYGYGGMAENDLKAKLRPFVSSVEIVAR